MKQLLTILTVLLSFASYAQPISSRDTRAGQVQGTHQIQGWMNVAQKIYAENLRPRLLMNQVYIERPGNILFELPDGEVGAIHSAYGACATRIADSDSLIALLKGDNTDDAFFYLSTDNGDSYTLIDTLWNKQASTWYEARMQEGIVFYESDTVFYFVKGRDASSNYSLGLFYALRNDIATVYEYDTDPIYTEGAIGTALGITVGDFALSDLFYYNDSCYGLVYVLNSGTGVYNTYLFSGSSKLDLTPKKKLFDERPDCLSISGSIMQDNDSMWHILEDVERGNSRYLTNRYARTLYGNWYEEPGVFLQPTRTTDGWDNYGVKGPRILKNNDKRYLPDVDDNGYTQIYYSGDSVDLNVQRAGKILVNFDFTRKDTFLTPSDTNYLAYKPYLPKVTVMQGGNNIVSDSLKLGTLNNKPTVLLQNSDPAIGIKRDASYAYYEFSIPDRIGYFTYRSSGIVYQNLISNIQSSGTPQTYAYIYGYIYNNTGSAALDNTRLGFGDCGDGTTKEGYLSFEGKNGSGWTVHSRMYISKFTQNYAPTYFGSTDKDPQSYTPPSMVTVDNDDIEVIGSSNGLILESPDGTRYRITVPNGGASLTITAL